MLFATPFSSNVILAKARAMYGNALKPKDFHELLNCHSVSEIAAYLKTNTSYASVLADINEATIHRGILEHLLRRKLYNDYASLGRYDTSVGSKISGYLKQRSEIEQIITCLRLLSAGHANDFFFAMPSFYTSHSSLDPLKMSRSKTYTDLLQAMERTPYSPILKQFAPKEDGKIRLTEIENALYTKLVNDVFSIIASKPKSVRKELTELYGTQIDMQNATRIFRLKKFFDASPDFIQANLLPRGGLLSDQAMDKLIHAPTADEALSIFLATPLGQRIPESERKFTHDLYNRAPYFAARKQIHYSIYPIVVMFAYMMLTDLELDDIINIIEGTRYGLNPEQIKPMLILANY